MIHLRYPAFLAPFFQLVVKGRGVRLEYSRSGLEGSCVWIGTGCEATTWEFRFVDYGDMEVLVMGVDEGVGCYEGRET
jgi:hypothetical protein